MIVYIYNVDITLHKKLLGQKIKLMSVEKIYKGEARNLYLVKFKNLHHSLIE